MKQMNYFSLFAGLVLFLFVAPIVASYFPDWSFLSGGAFVAMLILGVWTLAENSRWFRTGLVIGTAGIVLVLARIFVDLAALDLAVYVFVFLFAALSVRIAVRHVLFAGEISANQLVGTVCIYLLIGAAWSMLYAITHQLSPAAFNGVTAGTDQETTWAFVYHSFVTLTTLGYGDITPVSPLARVLCYLEAIVGQFYIAMLVASLVGNYLYSVQTRK